MSLRHVIAATDLSAPSRHAAERALLVAEERASVELAHVASAAPIAQLRRMLSDPSSPEERATQATRAELERLAMRLQSRFGVRPTTTVLQGPLIKSLIARSEEVDADLLVMGARGASFVRHHVLGATPERMLGVSKRPILVVKQTALARYRRVMVAVDLSSFSSDAIRAARMVAPDATLTLMHAFDVPFEGKMRYAGVEDHVIAEYRHEARQEALQRLRALCDQHRLSLAEVELTLAHGHPVRRILEQEQECDCDLIAMARHGAGIVHDVLVGSVTRRVIAESQSDVLVAGSD